jgi:hypothetical protein
MRFKAIFGMESERQSDEPEYHRSPATLEERLLWGEALYSTDIEVGICAVTFSVSPGIP